MKHILLLILIQIIITQNIISNIINKDIKKDYQENNYIEINNLFNNDNLLFINNEPYFLFNDATSNQIEQFIELTKTRKNLFNRKIINHNNVVYIELFFNEIDFETLKKIIVRNQFNKK